jgi:hypothetical protein
MKKQIVVVSILGVLIAFFFLSQRNSGQNISENGDPLRVWMIELVKQHPDPVISKQLFEEWKESAIAITPVDLGSDVAGSLVFYSPKKSMQVFGLMPQKESLPVLELNISFMEEARSNLGMRVQIMKTIRHEYEHYLQWKRGEAFQKVYAEGSNGECEEIWKRELPVYLADCVRWKRWWSKTPMSTAMEVRCQYSDDEFRFQTVLASQLGTKMPECVSVWKKSIPASVKE